MADFLSRKHANFEANDASKKMVFLLDEFKPLCWIGQLGPRKSRANRFSLNNIKGKACCFKNQITSKVVYRKFKKFRVIANSDSSLAIRQRSKS